MSSEVCTQKLVGGGELGGVLFNAQSYSGVKGALPPTAPLCPLLSQCSVRSWHTLPTEKGINNARDRHHSPSHHQRQELGRRGDACRTGLMGDLR